MPIREPHTIFLLPTWDCVAYLHLEEISSQGSARKPPPCLITRWAFYLIDVHKMAYSAEKQELSIFGGEGLKSIGRDSIVNKQCFLKS